MYKNKVANSISFLTKTIILFCFIYEFVLFLFPTPLLSSRKIAFLIVLIYHVIKKHSIKPFFKDKNFRTLLFLCLFCAFYIILLNLNNQGEGISAFGYYFYFILYSFFGVFLFAGFFNWNYEKLIKAITIVTIIQATWCILTFYFDEFHLLNDALFVIDKDENIDFLSESRLRSIGGAGSSLSVCIALSSFSFLYFIVKGKKIVVNTLLFFYCSFATLLTGTTGLIISIVSLSRTFIYSFIKGKSGFLFVILFPFVMMLLFYVLEIALDADQFIQLTKKLVGFYENGLENGTFEVLKYQKVSGISIETLIGTGLSRGKSGSVICFHDSGYIRNYFALGLIMAIVFYSILYFYMWRMAKKTKQQYVLLVIFLLMVMMIEYKEPYLFYYYPLFLFNSLFLAAKYQRS